LLGTLRAGGKRIALASSAKGPELAHYKKLAHIADLVDTETSSDDAEKSKPHPDIFQAALARLGDPPPPRCVVVADSPYDAEAAARAGLRSVAVLCGGFEESWLRAAGYAVIYKDPQHLLDAYRREGDDAFGRV
jgi:beta-phosphoglucomutase-like phosphatase (HAD superfamily)